ncbi:hypothetical protein NET03_11145 [Thermomicrobium sp. CFH 73360]|uniref:hypothetical protein n=1 Tax=Thermomicrobium sp. CFH 73360 TaxID=2951987 RepID=UPI002077503E|nr:hypothetical protein [Thermomicrobium sp. CFH 73360]MCM8747082.1 hypothetical protein [Thermomicrobium sp. CFH 73360]
MSPSVEEFRQLLRLVEQDPELREELRRHVLTEELLRLPAVVRDHGERLTRLEASVAELVQAVRELTDVVRGYDIRFAHVERELTELRHAVQELAATTREHSARLARLEELSAQHAERLARLDALLARQNERLEQLERDSQEFRAALTQLTEAVARLARKSAEHDRKLDRFSLLLGAYLERDAAERLTRFFEAEGWHLRERPRSITVNGEFDVVAAFTRGNETVWILIESKARIYPRDVAAFAKKLQDIRVRARLAEHGIRGRVHPFMVGGNIERGVDETCRNLGVGLIDVLGIAVRPSSMPVD